MHKLLHCKTTLPFLTSLPYNSPVTSKKGVVGFGDSKMAAAQSRNPAQNCGFFVRAPVLAARMGDRKVCRFTSSAVVPVRQPVRAASPFGDELAVVHRRQLEPLMAHTTGTPVLTLGTSAIRESDGLYSLNDLHQAAGGEEKHKPAFFLRSEQAQSLVVEIGKGADLHLFLKTVKGRNGGTYACRELVIAYAAWISAAFHLKVIRVFLASQAPIAANLPMCFPPAVEKAITDKAFQVGAQANQLATANLRHMVANLSPEVAIQKIESTPFADAIGTPSDELQQAYAHAATAVNALGHLLLSLDKVRSGNADKTIGAAASNATKSIAFTKGVSP